MIKLVKILFLGICVPVFCFTMAIGIPIPSSKPFLSYYLGHTNSKQKIGTVTIKTGESSQVVSAFASVGKPRFIDIGRLHIPGEDVSLLRLTENNIGLCHDDLRNSLILGNTLILDMPGDFFIPVACDMKGWNAKPRIHESDGVLHYVVEPSGTLSSRIEFSVPVSWFDETKKADGI